MEEDLWRERNEKALERKGQLESGSDQPPGRNEGRPEHPKSKRGNTCETDLK
jgi:hypothetical protein